MKKVMSWLVVALVVVLVQIMVLLWFVVLAPAQALDTPAFCDMVEATTAGERMRWDAKAQWFDGMPDDLVNVDLLYILDQRETEPKDNQGYLLMYSPSTQEFWIFPMWSLAAAQEMPGFTCAPRRYRLDELPIGEG